MAFQEWQSERNEQYQERHELSVDRIKRIATEDTVEERFQPFFQAVSAFLLELEAVRRKVENGDWERLKRKEMEEFNYILYLDILDEHYETSYANPAYAVKLLGEEYGRLLSFLYAEMRSGIPYVFENLSLIHI